MKKINILVAATIIAVLLSSCTAKSTLQKDVKNMEIRFKPLTRKDITLVGNLQTEITITGKFKKGIKRIDKSFKKNYKQGLINSSEATEIMYFAPSAGEAITGSLYDNEIFNSVYGTKNLAVRKSLFAKLFPGAFAILKSKFEVADAGLDFAYYALVEKYPDVDYFINVRFDRKTILKGKKFSETVIVKADGVNLKTD